MANRLKGEAAFEHDGKTLTVCINTNVLLKAEDEIGVGLEDLVGGLGRMGWLATLFRHALHEAVDEAAGALISRKEAAEILMLNDASRDALMRAFNAAMPKAEAASDGSVEGKA